MSEEVSCPTREVAGLTRSRESTHYSTYSCTHIMSGETSSLIESGTGSIAVDVDSLQYICNLKSLYKSLTPTRTSEHQWPPPSTRNVFNLAMIKEERVCSGKIDDPFVRMTITGKIDDILHVKSPIKLCQIFEEVRQRQRAGKPRKVVLMEGAPGCGKSTLSIFISQQWGEGKQFQEFEAVVLVRLRDPAVQSAKTVDDLFPSGEGSTEATLRALNRMKATNFQNVLFILDGWDELKADLRSEDSIFLNLIKQDSGEGKMLEGSTVIVTSRPNASGDLHDLVSLRIEILGFTQEELRDYFSDCLDGDKEAVSRLIEKIEENPAIAGICRLPLNASILVHLYKEYLRESLPTSQFGIFSLLICTCVSRHLNERTQYNDIKFESLDQILDNRITAGRFKYLCKVAYEGVMSEEITFSSLPSDIDTLSLLQGVKSFIRMHSKTSVSYNFIHLSIQEVLAALYMARSLTESEQVAKFMKLFSNPRFLAVFQYYAAITKLQTPGIRDIVDQVGKKCGAVNPDDNAKQLLISFLHCLNEAQDQSLCGLMIRHLQHGLNLGHTTLTPTDCLSTGYFLSRVCNSNIDEFQVNLFNCSIDDQACRYLVKGLQKCLEASSEPTTMLNLNLRMNCIHKEGGGYLSKLLQLHCVRTLHLNGNGDLSDEGVQSISEHLSNNTSLEELGLYECGITANGIGDLAVALMTCKSLKVLNLGGNAIRDDGIRLLADTLGHIQQLKSLNLACCGMTDIGLSNVVDLLKQNVSLMDIKLNNFLFQEHPNRIAHNGDAIKHLFSCIKQRSTPLTLVLPKDFKSSITDIEKDINDIRVKSDMAPVDIQGELFCPTLIQFEL